MPWFIQYNSFFAEKIYFSENKKQKNSFFYFLISKNSFFIFLNFNKSLIYYGNRNLIKLTPKNYCRYLMIEVKQSCSYLTVRQCLSQYKDFPNLPEYNFTIEVVSDTTFIWGVIYKMESSIFLSPYTDHIHCKMFDKFTTFIVQLIYRGSRAHVPLPSWRIYRIVFFKDYKVPMSLPLVNYLNSVIFLAQGSKKYYIY